MSESIKMELSNSVVAEANVKYYQVCADSYESIESTIFLKENAKRLEKAIDALAKNCGGGSLLDVGCGTGNVLRFAAGKFADVQGVDISEEMIEKARRYCGNVRIADATDLPFSEGQFDVVTAYSLLHHLYNPAPAIVEMYRVCKPGGIVFTDNDPNGYFQKKFKWYKNIRKRMYRKRNDALSSDSGFRENMELAEYHHYYSDGLDASAIKQMFLDAGFSKVDVRFRFHPRPNLFTLLIMVFLVFAPPVAKCAFLMVYAEK